MNEPNSTYANVVTAVGGLLLRLVMKTLLQLTLGSLMLILGLSACGSNSNSSTSATTYGYVNGVCYNTSSNTAVATSYCTGATYNSSAFSYSGTTCTNLLTNASVSTAYCTSNPFSTQSGGCYDSIGGTYVSSSYCSTTSSTVGGATYSSCVGMYYLAQNGYTQLVQCNGTNCRGYVLYSVATKTPVVCQ